MQAAVRSLLVLLALMITSTAYLFFAAKLVPPQAAILVNLIIFPLILGCVVAVGMAGTFFPKFTLVSLIPIWHIFYFGGDPAKPGLENMVAILEGLFIWIGLAFTHFWIYKNRRFF